jgi:hypothetical protein
MSAWRIAYKGSRLTLGLTTLLTLFSHMLMFLAYMALTAVGGGFAWLTAALALIHLSAICILLVVGAAVIAGRYEMAKILALIVLVMDIATIAPVIIRMIFLSLSSRWLGVAGGLGAPIITFILVYFMEDLEAGFSEELREKAPRARLFGLKGYRFFMELPRDVDSSAARAIYRDE